MRGGYRAFATGKPFMEVQSERFVPDEEMLTEMEADLEECGNDLPVFTETYLYTRLGKDDARFVLGVANEYADLIDKLGPEKVREILGR